METPYIAHFNVISNDHTFLNHLWQALFYANLPFLGRNLPQIREMTAKAQLYLDYIWETL